MTELSPTARPPALSSAEEKLRARQEQLPAQLPHTCLLMSWDVALLAALKVTRAIWCSIFTFYHSLR